MPYQLAVDSNNNLYIADFGNSRIRKVTSTTGVITTVAGNGIPAYNGDSIPATGAGLGLPFGVAVDAQFNIYITTAGDFRVRKVTNANIFTLAGNGLQGSSGDNGSATSATFNFPNAVAVDSKNRVYIVDATSNVVRVVSQQ
jgi:sugar lactone lactonase YvrE